MIEPDIHAAKRTNNEKIQPARIPHSTKIVKRCTAPTGVVGPASHHAPPQLRGSNMPRSSRVRRIPSMYA